MSLAKEHYIFQFGMLPLIDLIDGPNAAFAFSDAQKNVKW
jgi:hypothetical protein